MRTAVFATILFLVTAMSAGLAVSDDQQQAEAVMAAESFLLLVDTGQYAGSWEETALLFKDRNPKEVWVEQIGGLRPQMGRVSSREIRSARQVTSLPDAPEGKYYIIEYRTSFTFKKEALETVTPVLDHDGRWRVAGYALQ